jgi:methionyl-tRNA formyltransferase
VLETIILLTSPAEQPVLAATLLGHNPHLSVRPVATLTDLTALEPELLRHARLVAFATGVVVPPQVLNQLGYSGYNFHPGSPQFPGLAPAQFAIYHKATEFGATAHLMIDRVDAGPIVGIELFPVPIDPTVHVLELLAYAQLARLFWRLAKSLATQIEPLPKLPIQWSGQKSSRRLYAAMCQIPLEISKEELDRRIAAFGGNHFGINPTINFYGVQFRFTPDHSHSLSSGGAEGQILDAGLKKQDRAA